jgi:hypothetical protein
MKYRIIGETNANNKSFYIAQYQLPLWFGLSVWCTIKQHSLHSSWAIQYGTCAEAEAAVKKLIRSQIRVRAVVLTGEITGPA